VVVVGRIVVVVDPGAEVVVVGAAVVVLVAGAAVVVVGADVVVVLDATVVGDEPVVVVVDGARVTVVEVWTDVVVDGATVVVEVGATVVVAPVEIVTTAISESSESSESASMPRSSTEVRSTYRSASQVPGDESSSSPESLEISAVLVIGPDAPLPITTRIGNVRVSPGPSGTVT
jgi:hypothetical protein